ncbi:MAG: hypothetical protein HY741_03935 [Chloroflexi bacterium]|nr:hypothetical protein [Chloroflexota bacterium]
MLALLSVRRDKNIWFWFGIVPAGFYLLGFVALTFPLITTFSERLWARGADGWQSLWNLWWVHKALLELGQLPWDTNWIHYPYGVSLWTHTLGPFNGLVGAALYPFLSFPQIYNFVVLFSFVASGLTTFYLVYFLTKSYVPSLLAGYVFTFSSYHLAQSNAHLQLAATEWIPLFILYWYALWTKPGIMMGAMAAVMLGAVALCDYYYLFYCVIAAGVMSLWWLVQFRGLPRAQLKSLVAFAAVALVTVAPLVIPLAVELVRAPVVGHAVEKNSLDLVQLFVPGSNWRFAEWTRAVWSRWQMNSAEGNAALSISVLVTLGYVFWQRKKLREPNVLLWYLLLLVFLLLSIGPVLHWNGNVFTAFPMPYGVLTDLLPILHASGVPIRMVVMITLSAAVLVGYGLKLLFAGTKATLGVGVVLALLMLIEPLPKDFSMMSLKVPSYVTALGSSPDNAGVLDFVEPDIQNRKSGGAGGKAKVLYYQTLHQKPVGFGYVSRVSPGTLEQDTRLWKEIEALHWGVLCRIYNFRYLAVDPNEKLDFDSLKTVTIVYRDKDAIVYDLKPGGQCGDEAESEIAK